MAASTKRPVRHAARWLIVAVISLGACASDAPNLRAEGEERTPSANVPDRSEGLAVRLRGDATGDSICPGGTQPCVVLNEDVGSGPQSVLVTFNDGVASVVESEPIDTSLGGKLVDRCDDTLPESDFDAIARLPPEEQEAAEADGTYAYDTLGQYILTIPDSYAVRWLSSTQRVHLGVVGDAAPHVRALDDLGLSDVVCVAGGFAHTDAELRRAQNDVGAMLEGWAPLNEGAGWGADGFDGVVTVDMYEVDEAMLAESRDRFGDLVTLSGAFTVLNGSLDDLHEQLAASGEAEAGNDGSDLFATCGSVVFPTMPPEPGSLPPLDAEIQEVFDAFINGPLAEESSFIAGNDMRVAERTDSSLVLLGIGDEGYVNARFEKRGEEWAPTGWGGCGIVITAPGFGPAETILDPDVEPDPTSNTLNLWIQERNCASGEAPTDRPVVPVAVESATRVEITTLVAPVAGGADCPGNPWFPVSVELAEPLGERIVVDVHMPPGVELAWPPNVDR